MKDVSEFKSKFEPALRGILNSWRVWAGDDEIRALHIGFDSTNTEIAVSLLTDREPYLAEQGLAPLGEPRWPVADWRLCGLNETWHHPFPDAASVLDWMKAQSEVLDTDSLEALNQTVKKMLFDVATGAVVRRELVRFRRIASPFRIRVVWFFDVAPLDAELDLHA
jgi:hypothetical protein